MGQAENEFFNKSRVKESLARLLAYKKVRGSKEQKEELRLARCVRIATVVKPPARPTANETPNYDYDKVIGAKKALYDIRRECWLIDAPEGSEHPVERIGIWGQIWAFGLLWSLVAREADRPIWDRGKLVDAILEYGAAHDDLDVSEQTHELAGFSPEEKTIAGFAKSAKLLEGNREILMHYLSNGRYGTPSWIPPLASSVLMHQCFAYFIHHHLNQSDEFKPKHNISEKQMLEHLENVSYSTPQACFFGLVELFGISEAVERRENSGENIPKQMGISWFEPTVWQYMQTPGNRRRGDTSETIRRAAREIRSTLSYASTPLSHNSKIAVLNGPPHSGKKSVVGDFLINLLKDEADIQFTCAEDQNPLPVFCVQTRDREYHELCVEVLVFLERLETAKQRPPLPQEQAVQERWAQMEQAGGYPSLHQLLSRIRSLHADNPALFVFMDVRHTGFTDIRKLIKGNGIRRLLETLLESCDESRFFLTAASVEEYLEHFKPKKIKLNKPTCTRIAWYLNDDQLGEFQKLAERFDFASLDRQEIDGNILMLLAVLFSQPGFSRDQFFDLMKKCTKAVPANMRITVDDLCSQLVGYWKEQKILPYIALIAASDDGMMTATLESCMTNWHAAYQKPGTEAAKDDKATETANKDGKPRAPNTLSAVEMSKAVKTLGKLREYGAGLFLRHVKAHSFTIEEKRFDEPAFHAQSDYYKVWEFDQSFAALIRRLISETPELSKIMREANRLVAMEARSRARYWQLKGMTVRRWPGVRVPERSIQAFISLLLSLEAAPDPGAASASRRPRPIRLDTGAVFTLGKDFSQATALRYAVEVMLKSEIDASYRMSMNMDADLLRLRLYVLLCANPGSICYWDDSIVGPMTQLPEALKSATLAHLSHLGPKERGEVLVSLAMSAFYTGHLPILRWAEKNLSAIAQGRNVTGLENDRSRVAAARVDIEGQIGHNLTKLNENFVGGRPDTSRPLPYVLKKLDASIKGICPNLNAYKTAPDLAAMQPELLTDLSIREVEAWFRLQTRRAYLVCLIEPGEHARELVTELRKLDEQLAHYTGRSLCQTGRTGRLALRARTKHMPLLSYRKNEGWGKKIEDGALLNDLKSMIHANVSRLNIRYESAERAYTLVDHARHLVLLGKIQAAETAAQEARRITFQGASSDTVRLAVLQLETLAAIANVEFDLASSDTRNTDGIETRLDRACQNITYMDGIILSHGLSLERCFRHALVWRLQLLAAKTGHDIGNLVHEDTSEAALSLAETHEAEGLRKQLANYFEKCGVDT